MPILWRALIIDFIKIVGVCVTAFVALLLTMRLDEIAHFATMGASFSAVIFFILNQIPYILPIAIPLSSLIATFILSQRLSNNHTLTALRASGISLANTLTPFWMVAALLSIVNFWVISEIATTSHLQNNLMKSELRAVNPLLLLHNRHLMRLKGYHFEALGSSRMGESSSDVVLALPGQKYERIYLMCAQQLKVTQEHFTGDGITLITGIEGDEEDFDRVLVENVKHTQTDVNDLSELLQRKITSIQNDHLTFSLLLARIQEEKASLDEAKALRESKGHIKMLSNELNRSFSEISKRFSIAFAVFSCTFLGSTLGIQIGRRRKITPLFLCIGMTTLYLVAFFVAKGLDHHLSLATTLYFAPHILIITLSLVTLWRIERGIES